MSHPNRQKYILEFKDLIVDFLPLSCKQIIEKFLFNPDPTLVNYHPQNDRVELDFDQLSLVEKNSSLSLYQGDQKTSISFESVRLENFLEVRSTTYGFVVLFSYPIYISGLIDYGVQTKQINLSAYLVYLDRMPDPYFISWNNDLDQAYFELPRFFSWKSLTIINHIWKTTFENEPERNYESGFVIVDSEGKNLKEIRTENENIQYSDDPTQPPQRIIVDQIIDLGETFEVEYQKINLYDFKDSNPEKYYFKF